MNKGLKKMTMIERRIIGSIKLGNSHPFTNEKKDAILQFTTLVLRIDEANQPWIII